MNFIHRLKNKLSDELYLKEAFSQQKDHFISASILSLIYAMIYFLTDNIFVRSITEKGVLEMQSTVALPFSLITGASLLSIFGLTGQRYNWLMYLAKSCVHLGKTLIVIIAGIMAGGIIPYILFQPKEKIILLLCSVPLLLGIIIIIEMGVKAYDEIAIREKPLANHLISLLYLAIAAVSFILVSDNLISDII